MLRWSILFLIVALVAGLFRGLGGPVGRPGSGDGGPSGRVQPTGWTAPRTGRRRRHGRLPDGDGKFGRMKSRPRPGRPPPRRAIGADICRSWWAWRDTW